MKQIATEENVKKAYKQLKDAGSEITVGSIRKILGGGSYTPSKKRTPRP